MPDFQIAVINYPPEYTDLMNRFHSLHEPSLQGLEVMAKILEDYNPAHYTVWKRRWEFLRALEYDIDAEIEWINAMLLENPKTYQIWNYRQQLISFKNDPSNELQLLNEILADDPKNYHAWSYRQWLIKKFNMLDGELDFTASLIEQDPYNNSAWNHRHFLNSLLIPIDLKDEVAYVQNIISQYPDNESPWNYYRALLPSISSSDLEFVKTFTDNRFAVYTLFVWTKDHSYLDILSQVDPNRSSFWKELKNKS
jgi:protein farnesyltransferase/geranylgeranyltransferase type-1 subunit alpha